ncbi:molybdopterin molybdotransferase MoeA [Chitiniphilus purpureus]|uniref:Molybdopterin molybdenumtransferase n=1 Tax=Chitiniphilus purpureus TaxID=2981137 RepID=A0ABY6DND0_9NEIS|nr:gephyrin-like molybdotransferase Glp [Chitiniphilus sp. CD1]UXY15856.1 molybdopterin molybdotransferase MoeA [Chitiniphilus sp. CD1]
MLLSLEAMLARLAAQPLPPPQVESVPLQQAAGRISAATVVAALDLPPFAASAMDGYAVAMTTAAPAGPYRLAGYAAAGSCEAQRLEPGEALRVLTGAPLPAGCTAVVPQEQVRCDGPQLHLHASPQPGAHMRLPGSELAAGTPLLQQGERIRTLQIGLLASQGIAALQVYRRVRVGVLSSGNELQQPGEPLAPGRIYDANRPQLLALLAQAGTDPVDLGTVPDDMGQTLACLRSAAARCDVIISSGGASVGDADHMRAAVAQLGAIDSWRVAIKPGKPFAFGQVDGVPFLALPGNPVAAAVTYLLLAQPLLRRAAGGMAAAPQARQLPLTQPVHNPDERRHFLRARLVERQGVQWAEPFAQQGSAALSTLAQAALLLDIPAAATLPAGAPVRALILD